VEPSDLLCALPWSRRQSLSNPWQPLLDSSFCAGPGYFHVERGIRLFCESGDRGNSGLWRYRSRTQVDCHRGRRKLKRSGHDQDDDSVGGGIRARLQNGERIDRIGIGFVGRGCGAVILKSDRGRECRSIPAAPVPIKTGKRDKTGRAGAAPNRTSLSNEKKLENSLHRFGDQPQPAVRGLARGVAESSGLDGQVARLIYETDGSFFWKSRLAG